MSISQSFCGFSRAAPCDREARKGAKKQRKGNCIGRHRKTRGTFAKNNARMPQTGVV